MLLLQILLSEAHVDQELQNLVRKLGEAINDSINNSGEVDAALATLKAAGHEVFLVLEATIAFKDKIPPDSTGAFPTLTYEDRQFLRNLKIRLENE